MGFHSVLPKTGNEIDELRKHEEIMNRTPEEIVTYDLLTKLQKVEKGKKELAVKNRATGVVTGTPHLRQLPRGRRAHGASAAAFLQGDAGPGPSTSATPV